MNLSAAVELFLARQRRRGVQYHGGESILRAFTRLTGDVPVRSLSTDHILCFVLRPETLLGTQRSKFSIISSFLRFAVMEGWTQSLNLEPPPRLGVGCSSDIFTIDEVRGLLRSANKCQ